MTSRDTDTSPESATRVNQIEWIAGLKMAAVYPDGRPDRNGYAGGWNDALDEVLGILRSQPATTWAAPTSAPSLDVAATLRAKAIVLRGMILDLQQVRGRMSKVTVDDFAAVLGVLDNPDFVALAARLSTDMGSQTHDRPADNEAAE